MAKEPKDQQQKKGEGKPKGKGKAEAQVEAAAEPSKPSRPKLNNKASARLRDRYTKEVLPALMKELSLPNPMAVPRLEKVVVNMGVGEATQNSKVLDPAVAELQQCIAEWISAATTP